MSLLLVLTVSCNTTKLFKEYRLYHRDKTINYPTEKLTIKFNSNATGEFINADNSRETFHQTFNFERVKDNYLIIQVVTPTDKNFISLKHGDTIIIDKHKLHFFYNDDKKYLLSFKKIT